MRNLSILIGASVMLSLSMGMRQSLGLFVAPAAHDLGMGTAEFTLAIAVQNIVWGLTQPFVGAAADLLGSRPVMLAGAALYAAGLLVTIQAGGALAVTLGSGVLIGVALSCTAAGIAMSVTARAVDEASRSLVLGIVSAVGSIGTFVAAPLAQGLIDSHGWQPALGSFVALALLMIPAAWLAGRIDRISPQGAVQAARTTLRETIAGAARHRGYLVMATAFFVCGLQLVFLTTHLPTYLAMCGLDPMLGAQAIAVLGGFNVLGSYLFGWLGGRYPKHVLLGTIYILRSVCIGVYVATPPGTTSTLLFAAAIGMLWLGVVPLVNGLVAEMFGVRFMATLTGIAFFSHQLGSFVGAWGGGLVLDALGSYDRAWQFGVAIGLVAGIAQIAAGSTGGRGRGRRSWLAARPA